MASKLEKIRILKTVSIFSESPEDVLGEIAELLEEVEYQAGEKIFEKGDIGKCMYIILEGRVRVHDGEMMINFLGDREVFGEMAALDPQPRSASITAVTYSRLWRLEQEPLYSLMSKHIEVTRGIIHVLSQHLRDRVRDMAEDYRYKQQFAKVMAAAVAVEAGVYELDNLDEVAERSDDLGKLARLFQKMVSEIYSREQHLKQQVAKLRIEIDGVKKAREVSEITETDYFKNLRAKARDLRSSRKDSP